MSRGDKKLTTYAILTDIHGNIEALNTAVSLIDENPDVDEIICLGDNFSLGSAPLDVLNKLKTLKNATFIRGNHDRYLIEQIWQYDRPTIEGMDPDDPVCIDIIANEKWTSEQIGDEGLSFIRKMKMSHFTSIDNTYIEFTHAWFGRDEVPPTLSEAKKWRDHEQEKHRQAKRFVFVHGHTHIPRNEQFGNLQVLCSGSTGLPFDEDPHGAVAFLSVNHEGINWDVKRFEYNKQAAMDHLASVQPPFYKNLISTLKYAGIRNDMVE